MAGGFLQTRAAQVLRRLADKQDMLDGDRQELLAFLSGSHSAGYAPGSGEVSGLLKELGGSMSKSLADVTADEESAIQTYDALMKAKGKEVEALTTSIEVKTKKIGELGVQIVQMKEDVSDTEAALAQDKQFLEDLEKSCSTKTAEWDERSKTRADELVALADTIKILNDDDALELFKKTLPSASASLVQVVSSSSRVRSRAMVSLRNAQQVANHGDKPALEFIALALAGRRSSSGSKGFGKVIKMIDDMVALLQQEQTDDEHKKEYCGMQFDVSDDKKKALERSIAGAESAIVAAQDMLAIMTQEIKALDAGIQALDKSVAEATEQRKEENAEFKALVASDTAAKEVLKFAKNRLNQFYNPKLYKPPPKVELSSEDRIYDSMGGQLSTAAPTGIAVLSQVSAHRQLKGAPAPPPATWNAYATKP